MTPYKSYLSAKTQSQKPGALVARSLMKAVHHVEKAIQANDAKDIETRFNETEKANAVLDTLRGCLYDKGDAKEIAEILRGFYDVMDQQLCFFNVQQDNEYAKRVIKSLSELAKTWHTIDARLAEDTQGGTIPNQRDDQHVAPQAGLATGGSGLSV